MSTTPAVHLREVVKTFGPVTAVAGIDLAVEHGEFFSMLGPSGSGKTTVLRMIAGFEPPTSGRVVLGGEDVTDRAPHARDVNTVFQDYALFPHMDVLGNVEYGLRVKRVPRADRRRRAQEALEMVQLERLRRAQSQPALRGPAAAGRAGPGPGQPAHGAAARRAARRPRPQAAARDAADPQADPARGRHHLLLRDPRPGGGADDERPDRGLQRRPGRAGRHPRRAVRVTGQPVRRRLRRHLQPAHRRRRPQHRGPRGHLQHPPGEDPARSPTAGTPSAPTAGSAPWSTSARSTTTSSTSTAAARSPCSGRTSTATTDQSMVDRGDRVDLAWEDEHLIDLTGGATAGARNAPGEGEPS